MKKIIIPVQIVLLFITILVVFSCAVNPVTGKKQLMLMSEAQEVQMGIAYDPQVIATFGEYKNDNLLEFYKRQNHGNGINFTSP